MPPLNRPWRHGILLKKERKYDPSPLIIGWLGSVPLPLHHQCRFSSIIDDGLKEEGRRFYPVDLIPGLGLFLLMKSYSYETQPNRQIHRG